MKFKHEAYIRLNDVVIEEYYQTDYKRYKGYRLLAADGSMIELPYGKAIHEKFGSMNHSQEWVNCGWSIVIYDVLNEIIVDSKLHEYGKSERLYLMEQAKQMKADGKQKRDIIIADRGFPSLALFVQLEQLGYDFVIRYNGEQFLRELKSFAKSDKEDMVIEIALDREQSKKRKTELQELLKGRITRKMKLRVVKIKLPNGENEYLVSSILDKTLLQTDDFKKIYAYRWDEEEHFKLQKNSAELENFSGKTSLSILQDYYSRILILNLHSVLVKEAEKQLEEENAHKKDTLKYDQYKINRNVSYGLVHSHILKLLNSNNSDWSVVYDMLIEKLKRNTIPVRKGRNYPRIRKWLLKFSPNRRRAI